MPMPKIAPSTSGIRMPMTAIVMPP
jgi:hypothetical protein